HRIHVAQRVGGGNLTVRERVVDDRREEIHRLHERGATRPPVHTGIVRGPEVDQHPGITLRWEVAQHVSQLARGEFARSTGAGNHVCQTALHVYLPSWATGSGLRAPGSGP